MEKQGKNDTYAWKNPGSFRSQDRAKTTGVDCEPRSCFFKNLSLSQIIYYLNAFNKEKERQSLWGLSVWLPVRGPASCIGMPAPSLVSFPLTGVLTHPRRQWGREGGDSPAWAPHAHGGLSPRLQASAWPSPAWCAWWVSSQTNKYSQIKPRG